MDMYARKSRWKGYLGIGGLVIILISLLYTNYLATKLADEERKKVNLWLMASGIMAQPPEEGCLNCIDYTLPLEISKSNTTIPVILVSETGTIIAGANFGEDRDNNLDFLAKELDKIKASGIKPLEAYAQKIYYKNSTLLTLLKYFPVVQLILIGAYISFGYLAFSAARRSEQNRVWVGMAKETAHQLGTPTSAIVGWIEHLKSIREEDEELSEVLYELRKDVTRLELIAERFSKIGSAPELKAINVYDELEKCRAYMQRRASRRVNFHFPDTEQTPLMININPPLFDWVVENLVRNALDAMGGKGEISADVMEDNEFVYIDISDTGKGIPPSKHKTVFQPGYTTKKRGWGLGLSLTKRIIEDYHTGKIFVKKSAENEGTTFTIQLPKNG
jgi:signal transduction histidine kinase